MGYLLAISYVEALVEVKSTKKDGIYWKKKIKTMSNSSLTIITQAHPSYADNSILYGWNQGQPRFAWIDVEFLTKSIACVDRTWLFSSNLCRGASSALNFVGISLRSLKAENVCVCVMKFNSLLIPGWNPSSAFILYFSHYESSSHDRFITSLHFAKS